MIFKANAHAMQSREEIDMIPETLITKKEKNISIENEGMFRESPDPLRKTRKS